MPGVSTAPHYAPWHLRISSEPDTAVLTDVAKSRGLDLLELDDDGSPTAQELITVFASQINAGCLNSN